MAHRSSAEAQQASDIDIIDAIPKFYDNPLGHTMFSYPWGQQGTPLHDESGPDTWQVEVLTELGQAIRDGMAPGSAVQASLRLAVKAGNGPGKTALIAWIIIWFISTRPHPQITVTANTAVQLASKTWRELAKWHRLSITKDWFVWTATKYYAKHAPDTWVARAIPWSKDRPEAFAGTHEKHVLIIYDEASRIDDVIWEVTEGAMTTPGAMWIAFGNPTRNQGYFRECWRDRSHRWRTFTVDTRNAKKANRKEIEGWLQDWGEDNDWFKVHVRGEFPALADMQFIAEDMVRAAERRELHPLEWQRSARVFGLDVAYFGDDRSVLIYRQGAKIHWIKVMPKEEPDQLAYRVLELIATIPHEALFIERVGIGVGAYATMKTAGYQTLFPVIPQHNAGDERTYANKRAEMWGRMRLWIKDEACLAVEAFSDKEIREDLTKIEYSFDSKGRVLLESKDMLKRRGVRSPDIGDALALTFALPIPDPPELQGRNEDGLTVQQRLEDLYWGSAGPESWKVR